MEFAHNGRPRVVITGMSAITALGELAETWEGLKEGRSGVSRIESFKFPPGFEIEIAGEIKDFDPLKYHVNRKEARRMARCSQMTIGATHMAVADAGYTMDEIKAEGERVGVSFGTSMGGHDEAQRLRQEWIEKGYKTPSPFGLAASLPNMPAHYASREAGALGPISAVSVACATATQSIGDATTWIRERRADIVLSGGVEALVVDYAIGGFDAMRTLARGFNDRPAEASRPFDGERCGFVFSEGVCMLVLETLEHAVARGARIYAEIMGHASSSDAFHIAAPDEEGRGAVRAMRWAVEDAGLNLDQIDYINAHGSSTVANDKMETLAIKTLFGERAYQIPISSTKSMLGHLLGAGGAIEAAATALSLCEQVLHPTINQTTPDPDCDLDYVPNVGRDAKVTYALSNSFGFGGQNSCLVLGRFTG
ncbi:MAG: beta-ketoacyl-ACP synthase II [Anaerolineae bacterium]|nr:beta-ketoacyl-ACP synthase II [Anaerolineae bacterium]